MTHFETFYEAVKVKTAKDLVVSPMSTASVMAAQVPPRTVRNIRRGHLIRGMQDIAHDE